MRQEKVTSRKREADIQEEKKSLWRERQEFILEVLIPTVAEPGGAYFGHFYIFKLSVGLHKHPSRAPKPLNQPQIYK